MIDIDLITDIEWTGFYEAVEPENKYDLKAVGDSALRVFSSIAALTFVPAIFKKRRVRTIYSSNLSPITIIETEEGGNVVDKPVPSTSQSKQIIIKKIFETVATGYLVNPLVVWRLKQWGNEIDDVHPFRFLQAAPEHHVRSILTDTSPLRSLKINGVVGGVKRGMEREKTKKNLDGYICNFASTMNRESKIIREHIKEERWQAMVEYLFLDRH